MVTKARKRLKAEWNKSKFKVLNYLAGIGQNSVADSGTIYFHTGVPYKSLLSLLCRWHKWGHISRQLMFSEGSGRFRYYYKLRRKGERFLAYAERNLPVEAYVKEAEQFEARAEEKVRDAEIDDVGQLSDLEFIRIITGRR